jgi:predicted component of type VI protein secretion system
VFHYGDPVSDAGEDRHFEGVVVAAFRERSSGKWRYVVEDNHGIQQTFSWAQLLRR